ncbi:hypothetical protein GOBAR_DD33464 [Gossypium barbadense]|nr:hypothetical protein GOBAR_DD33464 [Gossypium barbadense]
MRKEKPIPQTISVFCLPLQCVEQFMEGFLPPKNDRHRGRVHAKPEDALPDLFLYKHSKMKKNGSQM